MLYNLFIGLKKEKKMKIKMPQFWVEKKNAGSFRSKNASKFGSENMPAVSGKKICQPFRVGKYDDNFGSENMSAI